MARVGVTNMASYMRGVTTNLNKIDSNYSYKCLETISCIRTTWNHINLTCKLKNMVT